MKSKQLKAMIAGMLFLSFQFCAFAQQSSEKPRFIVPYPLGITKSKTTNIIFPQAIIGVDRGSRDILAQKAKGVENILQVKAARDSFPETNLSVVTADGNLNSFTVNYTSVPQVLNLALNAPQYSRISLSPENRNMSEIQKYAKVSFSSKQKRSVATDRNSNIKFQVNGFFIHNDMLYCRVRIENTSNIGYDIDQLRFFIRDQQKAKRTTIQEIEINPVYVENDTNYIASQHAQVIIFSLPKFTIPDKKLLTIQLVEKNGGRHMELRVKNKAILRSNLLP